MNRQITLNTLISNFRSVRAARAFAFGLLTCVASFGAPVAAQSATAEAETAPAKTSPKVDSVVDAAAPRKTPAKLSAEAKASFGKLRDVRSELKGTRGAERAVLQQKVAKACEAVAAKHAAEPAAAARAWFEAGQSWRKAGELPRAVSAYKAALASEGVGRYLGRAHYELAQVQRRQKDWGLAIDSYRKAAMTESKSNRAQDARIWVARCLDAQGEAEAALSAFTEAVKAAATPRQSIKSVNWLAKELVSRGDLKAAQDALAALDTRMEPALREASTSDAAKLQALLKKMTARRALQRAQDRASGAAGDAADVERARSGGGEGVSERRSPSM